MASTYSPSLRLELMATGDQSGTWGVTTNTNLGTLLEQAITGVLSVAEGDTTLTLTTVNGGSDQARNAVVNLTGAMTANRNVIVQTPAKLYFIKNSTTGGFTVTAKTSAGSGVAIPPGTGRWVYSDGTNVVDMYSGALTPSANDGAALGLAAVSWADLFLASGGVINWNNGDVTITHSADALAFAGAASGYSFDADVTVSSGNLTASSGNLVVSAGTAAVSSTATGTLLTLTSTDAGASSGPDFEQYRNSASPATNDILGRRFIYGKDSAGNKQEYASDQVVIVDATSTSEDAAWEFNVTVGGTPTKLFALAELASGTADPNNVALPKGQLSFPATQNPSSDANTLDDYEEGTWTPAYSATGCTFSYTSQVGTYTKIGNRVFLTCNIALNTSGNTLAANPLTITGLPFANGETVTVVSAAAWIGAPGTFVNMQVAVTSGSSSAAVNGTSSAQASSNLTVNATSILSATNGTIIRFSMQYKV